MATTRVTAEVQGATTDASAAHGAATEAAGTDAPPATSGTATEAAGTDAPPATSGTAPPAPGAALHSTDQAPDPPSPAAEGPRGDSEAAGTSQKERFRQLSLELNLDQQTFERGWKLWQASSEYLCRDDLGSLAPWFACVIYVAGHKAFAPASLRTVAGGAAETCVSMSGLLRLAGLTPMQFFQRLEDFAKRAVLDPELEGEAAAADADAGAGAGDSSVRQNVRQHASFRLREIEVVAVLLPKFKSVFNDLFPESPGSAAGAGLSSPSSGGRHEARRRHMLEFAWTLFLCAKGRHPGVSSDLVSTFYLMICCLHYCYLNARQSAAWVNPTFETADGSLRILCRRHTITGVDSLPGDAVPEATAATRELFTEASVVNDRVWRPFVASLVRNKTLTLNDDLTGCFYTTQSAPERRRSFGSGRDAREPVTALEHNTRGLTQAYEAMLVEEGAVDERPLLSASAPGATPSSTRKGVGPSPRQRFLPSTPMHSPKRGGWQDAPGQLSQTLNGIALLRSIVASRADIDTIPESLLKVVHRLSGGDSAEVEWQKAVTERLSSLCDLLSEAAVNNASVDAEVLRRRWELAARFYYKVLEAVLLQEVKPEQQSRLMGLLLADAFHRSLFACCTEVTLYAHETTELKFPWVLTALKLAPFEFQKVIEIVVRAENGLSAAFVKHLSHCENICLEALAWQDSSPLLPPAAPAHVEAAAAGGGESGPPPRAAARPNRSKDIFLRKVLNLASARLVHLCQRLDTPPAHRERMSMCLRHAIEGKHLELLLGRHVDVLMICSVYALSRLMAEESRRLTFARIIETYRSQSQATSAVCFEIRLPDGSVGDIVQFYNQVFVPVMESVIRDLGHNTHGGEALTAPSPLPKRQALRPHSPRKVSRRTAITVSKLNESPAKARAASLGYPSPQMSYNFHQSPSKSLRRINRKLAEGGRGLQDGAPKPRAVLPPNLAAGSPARGATEAVAQKRPAEAMEKTDGQQKRAKASLMSRFSEAADTADAPGPSEVAYIDAISDGAAEVAGVSAMPSSGDSGDEPSVVAPRST